MRTCFRQGGRNKFSRTVARTEIITGRKERERGKKGFRFGGRAKRRIGKICGGPSIERDYLRGDETAIFGRTDCREGGTRRERGGERAGRVDERRARAIRGTKKSRGDVISTPTRVEFYRLGNCVRTVNFNLLSAPRALSFRAAFTSPFVLSSRGLARACAQLDSVEATKKATDRVRVVNGRGCLIGLSFNRAVCRFFGEPDFPVRNYSNGGEGMIHRRPQAVSLISRSSGGEILNGINYAT